MTVKYKNTTCFNLEPACLFDRTGRLLWNSVTEDLYTKLSGNGNY